MLALPDSLLAFVKLNFPDYRIAGPDDLTGQWASYAGSDGAPFACRGDFNGDGRPDIALLLIGRNGWRLQAFHHTAEQTHEALKLERFPGKDALFTASNPPQNFHLFTLKAGDRLTGGAAPINHSVHEFDSIAFFLLSDPSSGMHYKWSAAHRLYGAIRYGSLID